MINARTLDAHRPPRLRIACLIVALLAAALWALRAVHPAHAQNVDPTPTPAGFAVTPAAPAAPAAFAPISADQINDVARQLWCPLCSGVRLDACELKACEQMKDEIGIMLANGEDVQQIKTTFVNRYGPQVLGEPDFKGFNWLAWVLPFAVLIGGGVFLYLRARTMVQAPAPAEAAPARTPSEYDRKLDDELRQYD